MKLTHLTITALALGCLPLAAQVIGTDDFTYPDGSIDTLAGGTGFDYDDVDDFDPFAGGASGTASDWDGNAVVTSGALVTFNGTNAFREYNGPGEGGPPSEEGDGARRGTGQIFYKFDMTRASSAVWGGLSNFDFGTERAFFGVTGGGAAADLVGIGYSGVGEFNSAIAVMDDSTNTLVAVVDFDNDLLAIFVNPDANDYWSPSTGSNSSDFSIAYTGGNWSSELRFASDGEVTWDNLCVAIDPTGVGLQATSGDQDNDGLPADWEAANGLDDNDDGSTNPDNGASGDPDNDLATNIQEFNAGTDPQNPDSDGDDLNDGAEINVEATDPLDPDSDDDCLTDGEEANPASITIYTNTDPNVPDTDTGGTNDWTEIALGTDPTSGNAGDDLATAGDLDVIGIEFFDAYADGPLDGKNGGAGWDQDNSVTNDAFTGDTTKNSGWSNVGGAPQTVGGRLVTQENSIKRAFHGGPEGPGTIAGEAAGAFRRVPFPDPSENGRDLLYLKVELTRRAGATWTGASLYNFGSEEIFIGVPSAQLAGAFTFGIEESGTANTAYAYEADGTTPIIPFDDSTHVIVARLDFDFNTVDLFVDPDLSGAEPDPLDANAALSVQDFANMNGTAIRLASGGGGQTEWDSLVVATTWAALDAAAADTDNDGMPDDWELANGLNVGVDDSGDDNDATGGPDGLTNLQEYLAGTNPQNSDTDGDGLSDGTQESAAGTNPLIADTDGDGRSDGDEVNGSGTPISYTSDPLVVDTDGDGQPDGSEVLGDDNGLQSDPNDINDTIGTPFALIGCDDFESYGDGALPGKVGGIGFDFDNSFEAGDNPYFGHDGTQSDWNDLGGSPAVVGGVLVTQNTLILREYNGLSAGTEANPSTEERSGAHNESGDFGGSIIYYRVDLTRQAGASWGGASSYDFGAERMIFGVPGTPDPFTGNLTFGIEEGGAQSFTGIEPVPGQAYTIVAKIDFFGDLLSMWVNPDLTQPEGSNPPDATKEYFGGNWTTAIRLGSGGDGPTEWDNLVVARGPDGWAELGKFPGNVFAGDSLGLRALDFDEPGNLFNVQASGLTPGTDYYFQSYHPTLEQWDDLPSTAFTASAATEDRDIPADEDVTPVGIVRLVEGTPAP